jgi:ATP-independent RNA helicase DbpA
VKAKLFSETPLPASMILNLESLGFNEMTEIQASCLEPLIHGQDVLAQAKTGSGKTVAFGIATVLTLELSSRTPSSLVICPTRELAEQVAQELRKLARHISNVKVTSLCGGIPIGPQLRSLEHGAHIVVGTPGRIQDHLRRGTLDLSCLKTFVLDEADRMLDMGFLQSMQEIAESLPVKRQTLLFSATYPDEIIAISKTMQDNPVTVKLKSLHSEKRIRQIFIDTYKGSKSDALLALISHYNIESALVFCQTKQTCDEVADRLFDAGYFADAIHSDLDQKQRDEVLTVFTNGSLSFLVATDVAARGLDIKALPSVIVYDLARDPEIHIHRIGRTGRADEDGFAISLYSDKHQTRVEDIESFMNTSFERVKAETLEDHGARHKPTFATIKIDAGKKHKIRPGDILGALTGQSGLEAADIGKIKIYPFHSYVAIRRSIVAKACNHLLKYPPKGRAVKARIVR